MTKPPPHDDLSEQLERLVAEVKVLRQVLDEIRAEVEWANRNHGELPSPFRLTSLPSDPCADDFAGRINRVPADVVERLRAELSTGLRHSSARQSELF